MKNMICFLLCVMLVITTKPVLAVDGQPQLDLKCRSSILMESSTGEILYDENADEKLPIASVTKIMTMLLIMEALDEGKFTLDSMVSVSERAMSMGGSTMFLETGEQLSVNDMLKGIAVASANDGCVAMAEYVAGSESAFIDMMNQRAKELGMSNTHFVNTNGLDDDNHYSSARDVAIMSRELIKHEKIFDYTTIWTDSLRDGKFQLANTNKLIRFYDGANGLKTGSTSKAKCCLSATAKRNNLQLIAVVLGAENSKERFNSARALLDYGFSAMSVQNIVERDEEVGELFVYGGVNNTVLTVAKEDFSVVLKKGTNNDVQKEIVFTEKLKAPIYEGDIVGRIIVKNNGTQIGEVPIIAKNNVEKKTLGMVLRDIINKCIDF